MSEPHEDSIERLLQPPRGLRVLRNTGLVIIGVSLLSYPLLLIAVNLAAPHVINTSSMFFPSDPISSAGQGIVFIGLPVSVALLGLFALLTLHRAHPEWIARQRAIALTAASLLAAVMVVLAFWAAFYFVLIVGGMLR
jgi:hypothetical protein